MNASLHFLRAIPEDDAAWIAENLCRPGSEMQSEFSQRRSTTPVVVMSVDRPIAWVATHTWREHQTLEAFTDPAWRRRGIARIGALMLLASWYLIRSRPVAVFSRDCVPLARSLGFAETLLYQRHGDGWRLDS